MQKFLTTRCSERGHPEFALLLEPESAVQQHVDSFLSGIESMVLGGTVFRPGETLQYGWMTTLVQELDDGMLTLHEPNMKSIPIEFVPGVTETVRQMTIQLFTMDSFSVDRADMDVPTVCQSGVVCERFLNGVEFIMARSEPSDEHDSGWFIGCSDRTCDHENARNLQRLSLYEVFLGRPQICNWITFPIGTLVHRTDDSTQVFRDGDQLKLVAGSFFDASQTRH